MIGNSYHYRHHHHHNLSSTHNHHMVINQNMTTNSSTLLEIPKSHYNSTDTHNPSVPSYDHNNHDRHNHHRNRWMIRWMDRKVHETKQYYDPENRNTHNNNNDTVIARSMTLFDRIEQRSSMIMAVTTTATTATPINVGWIMDVPMIHDETNYHNDDDHNHAIQLMNRNARYGKRANHGKRAVSRQRRRRKKRSIGNHRR